MSRVKPRSRPKISQPRVSVFAPHMAGKLFVVSTPIGNLDDLSDRARSALSDATLIACEDTRRTGRLMAHIGTKRPLVSLHEHNERQRLDRILGELEGGATVALVSDAGTPLLSDPGYLVVRAAIENGTPIEAIPGPSALLTALVVSGLPPYPFTFAGFPPPKQGRRKRFYERFADLDHTLIFFESPHRLLRSLEDARELLGDRPAAVARELTKLYEETVRGTLSEVREELADREKLKGEFVLVVGGKAPD